MGFDIGSIVVKKDRTDSEGVWVEWNDELSFCVNYIGKDTIKEARNKSLVKKPDRKTHRIVEEVNDEVFDKELMARSFSSWKGMKVKHLRELLDPSVADIKITPDNENLAVEFSDEAKEILVTCYNLTFSRFITSVATEIDVYQNLRDEQLTKN